MKLCTCEINTKNADSYTSCMCCSPESVRARNDTFNLVPELSCVPDSPVWYSTARLGSQALTKMLNRVRVVKEIHEAHLHYQPPDHAAYS